MMRAIAMLLLGGCTENPSNAPPDGDADMDADSDADCDWPDVVDVPGCNDAVGTNFDCEGQRHDTEDPCGPQDWQTNPPQSGTHCPRWEQDLGEHAEVVPRYSWVHNLEHGAVVLLHNCPTACDAELDVLRQVIADRADKPLLMTPDPDLDPPRFAAVSWTWIYETDAPDLATLLCFVDQHACQAPEGEALYGAECLQ